VYSAAAIERRVIVDVRLNTLDPAYIPYMNKTSETCKIGASNDRLCCLWLEISFIDAGISRGREDGNQFKLSEIMCLV